jgi:hypothetical protein
MTLQTAKGRFQRKAATFAGKNTMKKQPVHIIFDKILSSSEEATNYANSRGFKITHIEKYFMKGTHVFLYKFTKANQSNEPAE